jgi:hypothetical protein
MTVAGQEDAGDQDQRAGRSSGGLCQGTAGKADGVDLW